MKRSPQKPTKRYFTQDEEIVIVDKPLSKTKLAQNAKKERKESRANAQISRMADSTNILDLEVPYRYYVRGKKNVKHPITSEPINDGKAYRYIQGKTKAKFAPGMEEIAKL